MSENARPWYADMIEDHAWLIFVIVMSLVLAITDGRCSLRVVNTPTTQPAQEASQP